jgi:DNA adenine methylase
MGYLGSKAVNGAFQAIVAAMPAHDTYIETHLGSGAVMKAKPRAPWSIGVDLDPEAIAAFRRLDPWPDLVAGDCVGFLQGFDFARRGRVLVYADPPYPMSTRSAVTPRRYRCDYTDDDHRRLIGCLRALPAKVMVMISSYPSALYDELVGDWRSIRFQVMTRGGPRTEVVWMSFPEGAPHWHSYAGRDYVERQRIKRKAERWAKMYRPLPAGERLAVLAALLAEEGDPAA